MKKAALVVLLGVMLAGCNEDDARVAWSNLAKHCGIGDASGPTIVPFGPSRFGPGRVWRQNTDNSIQWNPNAVDPVSGAVVVRGVSHRCDGTATTDFGFLSVVNPYEKVLPITGATAYDLKRAVAVSVRASAMTWDILYAEKFLKLSRSLPSDRSIHNDAPQSRVLVVTRALRVSGFQVTLQFNAKDIPALRQRYAGPIKHAVAGSVGGTINALWSKDGQLTLSASEDFYVAGELTRLQPPGRAGNTNPIRGKPVSIAFPAAQRPGPPLERIVRP